MYTLGCTRSRALSVELYIKIIELLTWDIAIQLSTESRSFGTHRRAAVDWSFPV